MRKFLISVYVLFVLGSCATQDRCSKKFPVTELSVKDSFVIRDSVVVKIKDSVYLSIKDSIVYSEGMSGKDSMPCTENGRYVFKRGGDVFTVMVKDGTVFFDYNLKATQSRFLHEISFKNSQIDSLKTAISLSKSEKVVVLPEKKESLKDKIFRYVQGVLSLIGLIWIISYLFRLLIRKLSN